MNILKNTLLSGLILLSALSCKKDDGEFPVKQGDGEVWLSGGLYHCAQQIRLDNGNTLVVSLEDVISLRTGDRVNIKYKEIGKNENCAPYMDSEVVEIVKLESPPGR